MPDTNKATDKVKELAAAFIRFGLEPNIIKAINNTLTVDAIDDFYKLPAEVQNQAYLAAVSNADRPMLDFVQMLVTELRDVVEIENSGGGVRAPPGGINGVYGGLHPHGALPSKDGKTDAAVVGLMLIYIVEVINWLTASDMELTSSRGRRNSFTTISMTSSAKISARLNLTKKRKEIWQRGQQKQREKLESNTAWPPKKLPIWSKCRCMTSSSSAVSSSSPLCAHASVIRLLESEVF